MAGAYSVFANEGKRVPPVAILRIEDAAGRIIEEYRPPAGEQVISPQHAYLITDILSDNKARAGAFGPNSSLKLSRPAAAKTGTTDDWRDSWTMGYTPELVAGVWVGNADNTPMKQVTGSSGAGPIWHNFMERALGDQPASQFARPDGIDAIEISTDAGSLPGEACPPDRRRTEIFAAGQGPLGPEYDFHQFIGVDVTTNARATEYCPADLVEERYYFFLPGEEGQKWAQEHGIPQPPAAICPVHAELAPVVLSQPAPGETVFGEVYVGGRANLPDFHYYMVEYAVGQDPIGWGPVAGPIYAPVDGGLLAIWNVTRLENRDYSVRVVVYDQAGNAAEARTWVWVQNATPTATVTPTWTPTATGTATPEPTFTPTATETPWPTDTPAPTPTDTPRPTDTPTPTLIPTFTPTPTDLPTIPPPTITIAPPTVTVTATLTLPTAPPP
jgi:membrane peptidoglycan carboxypeptidase